MHKAMSLVGALMLAVVASCDKGPVSEKTWAASAPILRYSEIIGGILQEYANLEKLVDDYEKVQKALAATGNKKHLEEGRSAAVGLTLGGMVRIVATESDLERYCVDAALQAPSEMAGVTHKHQVAKKRAVAKVAAWFKKIDYVFARKIKRRLNLRGLESVAVDSVATAMAAELKRHEATEDERERIWKTFFGLK